MRLKVNLSLKTGDLGSGQFGTVNRAVWSPSPSSSSPRVEVIVKSLEGESTEEKRVKFLQEAAIIRQFKHPNIIRIAGVVTTSDPVRYFGVKLLKFNG